jgi:hypothetical protein
VRRIVSDKLHSTSRALGFGTGSDMGSDPGASLTWDRPDVGAQHPEQVNLFLTLRVGHVDHAVVTL